MFNNALFIHLLISCCFSRAVLNSDCDMLWQILLIVQLRFLQEVHFFIGLGVYGLPGIWVRFFFSPSLMLQCSKKCFLCYKTVLNLVTEFVNMDMDLDMDSTTPVCAWTVFLWPNETQGEVEVDDRRSKPRTLINQQSTHRCVLNVCVRSFLHKCGINQLVLELRSVCK